MLTIIDIATIKRTLPTVGKGLDKYIKIMDEFRKCDVSQDLEFQRTYKGFYRMRQRTPEFYKCYFDYMEAHKSSNITFSNVLSFLYESTSRIESSFSSKMLATINPEMPVWDVNVLSNLSIHPPRSYHKERLKATIDTYSVLLGWYTMYTETQNAREVIGVFDTIYPGTKITNVKKIDLALWSLGERKSIMKQV